jgi:hypothetical protein
MRSTDWEYQKAGLDNQIHRNRIATARSPFTRGRALEQMINVEQLPKATYLNMVYSSTGSVPTFYFVVGYSRVGGPDVVR